MKKSILLKNKDRLNKLKKSELINILEIELGLRMSKNEISCTRYKPDNSKKNNAKRAIKKFWNRRNDSIVRIRIKNHIETLRFLNE